MIPTLILQTWFLGLLSLGVVGGAIYFGNEWQQRSWGWDAELQRSVFAPHFGQNPETAIFLAALLLTLIALMGGPIIRLVLHLLGGTKASGEVDPRKTPVAMTNQTLKRPDGSELRVEFHGPPDGIPIVLTHGWGLDSREWNYLKRELVDRFRLITWDEPGLGSSTRPANRDYSLENLARDLEAVLSLVGKPAFLLGHSIGGMIILTFCRLFPSALGTSVSGLVLTHTTPTNPVRTTSGAAFYTAIEKPVLFPLMYLTIVLSPLLWLMNWLSYFNGSAHLSAKRGSFAGTETWEEIDFAARFQLSASPAVLARGMLGMMRYDALKTLQNIRVPSLIVAGDQDSTTKPFASKWIHRGIPDSQLVTLSPAKHLGLLEHHESYAKAVRGFADSIQFSGVRDTV